ncbi:hypothetical protein DXT68_16120 [Microbacterium foliorum]|uniref:ABC transporter permease n=1 Tax=Microbacterium foliorum TaxID=104336 RepID=A0A0F0KXL0_9MICO|nr:hypothetical protein [Microbacterium foliorum]AXL13482.1 hypothetical protein DXT68_16120 [Microbacterium foliorum]KJL25633.1 hypothetical protein RN50_00403 [Microbacterium foliorum]
MVRQAFRAQFRSLTGDVVLLGVASAAFVMALSLAVSVPTDFADAPAQVRQEFLAPFGTIMATYGAVLAAIYGSFRYTIDRRNGVVAHRLTLQPRWASFLSRAPVAALGGALVALATVVGGHVALTVSTGGTDVDLAMVAATSVVGAVAGLWGFGVGLVVQQHLLALFVAPVSLGAAMVVAIFWAPGAVWFPLPAILAGAGFDLSNIGIDSAALLEGPLSTAIAVAWTVLILAAGATSFLSRDVT